MAASTRPAGPPPVTRQDTPDNRNAVVVKLDRLVQEMNREDRYQQFTDLLGSKGAVDRWKAIALNTVATNSDLLQNCTVVSLIEACRDAAVLGLQVNGLNGEGWIIRYGSEAKFQPGWQGLLKLTYQNPKIRGADVQVVYEKDEFDWTAGTHPNIDHRPYVSTDVQTVGEGRAQVQKERPVIDRGIITAVYAWAELTSGMRLIEVMTWLEIEQVRKGRRGAETFSPWDTHWSEMARKTVLRRLMKRLPKSTEMDVAMALDAAAEQAIDSTVKVTVSAREKALAQLSARTAPALAAGEPQQAPEPAAPASEPQAQPAPQESVEDVSGEAGGQVVEAPATAKVVSSDSTCEAPAPEGYRGGPCVKDTGHENLHRNAEKETWE